MVNIRGIQNAFSRGLRKYKKYKLSKPNTEAVKRSYAFMAPKYLIVYLWKCILLSL